MPSPLVDTKLYIPPLRPSAVSRPRVTELLDRGRDARLILVSAPPGFGKTTALAAWLAERDRGGRSIAWLSLEESERAPASFWTYVLTSLASVVPGVGAGVMPLLQSPQPPIEVVLTTVLNELCAREDHLYLVLDDYHLADGPGIAPGMAFLLDHLPPHLHVVLSTRSDPALPLARLRARGDLVEVRGADLRFTVAEVAAYLNGASGLDLDVKHVAVLEERTEGGSPRSSWRPCRCVVGGICRASSTGSPGTTVTSSTTSSRRCWPASRTTCAPSWSGPASWTA